MTLIITRISFLKLPFQSSHHLLKGSSQSRVKAFHESNMGPAGPEKGLQLAQRTHIVFAGEYVAATISTTVSGKDCVHILLIKHLLFY